MVSYSPASGESEIRKVVDEFFGSAEYVLQEGRNVTEKVRASFDSAFKIGYSSASLIPGDHPDLDGDLLAQAIKGVDCPNPTVFLGPTFDGGAYLLGFNRASFDRVRFSLENTHLVCADIFLKSKELGIPCRFLDNRNDIDDWDDARHFVRSQEES